MKAIKQIIDVMELAESYGFQIGEIIINNSSFLNELSNEDSFVTGLECQNSYIGRVYGIKVTIGSQIKNEQFKKIFKEWIKSKS